MRTRMTMVRKKNEASKKLTNARLQKTFFEESKKLRRELTSLRQT